MVLLTQTKVNGSLSWSRANRGVLLIASHTVSVAKFAVIGPRARPSTNGMYTVQVCALHVERASRMGIIATCLKAPSGVSCLLGKCARRDCRVRRRPRCACESAATDAVSCVDWAKLLLLIPRGLDSCACLGGISCTCFSAVRLSTRHDHQSRWYE